ncbi:tRNA preQ1(34) S-adenosylmethionine ribosyltransferase-isomerase QueA [Actomonas aquatica]|uniref:S-adenosylmethionine:tRNA ribosyltransferase-isomerase n=1 Tax=Actomonas aquatica TaxID=2866162 RepID=A0ABZ1C874_9BACT|nr:tRNA preQ1(34) S-adenosylmethionine ribosyltransferase-isomerase QueA [Opitutus sp. WL0086]WRQ87590.1 tRNA preQ1(34) S-adenosylmethionine ribosyltransferase-isomerase QueA [Opitutus sp. WL0086]
MSSLSTDLFDYDLPDHLIAQSPAARRDASRLLVVNRAERSIAHHAFTDLPGLLDANDVLIRNNAAVLPARLRAVRPTGGAVECFLLRAESTDDAGTELWWCLLRPGKRLPVGATFAHAGAFSAEVREKHADGVALVAFRLEQAGTTLKDVANRLGEMPLPPYIQRPADDTRRTADLERYQTVYADRSRQVAVAAPTAGLHFTPQILDAVEQRGITTAEVTLHVGLGTFRPVMVDNITDHDIHRELYELPPTTQATVLDPGGRRRVAVGTTSVRAIEDFCRKHTAPLGHPCVEEADIFIYPPRTFRSVDALITNFHQPRSTLLCLVSAFLTPGSTDGIAWIREIYAEAIAHEYRFFSYGDAMLIV